MFGQLKNMAGQFQLMQKLMKDENFKAFMTHPKVQELFNSAEFKEIAKSKDMAKISAYKPFVDLMRDPEVAQLISKLNPKDFMGLMG